MKAEEFYRQTAEKALQAIREDPSLKLMQQRCDTLVKKLNQIQQDYQARSQVVAEEVWVTELRKHYSTLEP